MVREKLRMILERRGENMLANEEVRIIKALREEQVLLDISSPEVVHENRIVVICSDCPGRDVLTREACCVDDENVICLSGGAALLDTGLLSGADYHQQMLLLHSLNKAVKVVLYGHVPCVTLRDECIGLVDLLWNLAQTKERLYILSQASITVRVHVVYPDRRQRSYNFDTAAFCHWYRHRPADSVERVCEYIG